MARLAEAGLVATRPEGNRTLVRAPTTGAILADLRSLLAKVYGPVAALREAFRDLPVEQVVIFGSWAARWTGEPGPPPNDVDVLVVGDAAYEQVWDAAARLSSALGSRSRPCCARQTSGRRTTRPSPPGAGTAVRDGDRPPPRCER